MGKIIIDTSSLDNGEYKIRKDGPRQFSLVSTINGPSLLVGNGPGNIVVMAGEDIFLNGNESTVTLNATLRLPLPEGVEPRAFRWVVVQTTNPAGIGSIWMEAPQNFTTLVTGLPSGATTFRCTLTDNFSREFSDEIVVNVNATAG